MNVRTPAAPVHAAPRPAESVLSVPLALLIYFALSVVYFFPAFVPGQQIYGTDWLVGGIFFHDFISERFAAGQLPKWVPHVYGGLPLFSNPGSTYYPFRFVADWLFPVSKIWPALFVIQFTLAGIGTYLLARELRIRPGVAFVAGLAFQFTGITLSWVFAGHEGRIIVATFAPLVFFFFHRGIRTGELAPFAGAAAAVGFSLLSFQIQVAYYLLVGALLWSIFAIWQMEAFRDRGRLLRIVALGVGAVAFGFALAAVNFLPFLDYVDASPRAGAGGRGYDYSVSFSMPTAELSAIAVPERAGHLESYQGTNPMKLHTEYVGAVVLTLVALGFYYARRSRYFWFFAALAVFTLTIALGGNTPVYRLWYELLPGTKKFRAPSISFFLFSFSLAMMAAIALEAIAERVTAAARRDGKPAVEGTAIWILAGVVVLGFLLGTGAVAPGGYRFAIFALITAGALWLWMQGSYGLRALVGILAVVTVVDLWVVGRPFFQTVPAPDELFAEDDVARFLGANASDDRVWVLPFPAGAVYRGQAGNYLMRFDVDQAGGEHGNQLQRWNEYLGAGQETYIDWHNFLQYPAFLNAANIRYIVTGAPIGDIGLPEAYRGLAGVVYENPGALPRAYLVPSVVTVAGEKGALERMQQPDFDPRRVAVVSAEEPVRVGEGQLSGGARVVEYDPDRVVVQAQASRPALLVLADNYYEGWRAEVDGREAPIVRTNHTLRGVVVPAGTHTVTFTYEPADLYTGLYIYLAGLALLGGYALFLAVRYARSRRAPAAVAG